MSKIDFSLYDLVMFDLDDTLYDEKKYLFPAYEKIAIYIAENNSEVKINSLLLFFKTEFINNGRSNLFEKAKKKFKVKFSVTHCLLLMRSLSLDVKLTLFKNSFDLLSNAILKSNICIVTNGNPLQQKNKVNLIDWKGLDKKIKFYYANEVDPKPSKKIFTDKIKYDYNINTNRVLMIGDSLTDYNFSKTIGCSFIYIDKIDTQND